MSQPFENPEADIFFFHQRYASSVAHLNAIPTTGSDESEVDTNNNSALKGKDDEEFWLKQKQLLSQMSNVASKSIQAEQREKFARRRIAIVSDTAFVGFFIFCALWTAFDNPFVAFSYALGATLGLASAYGLGTLKSPTMKSSLRRCSEGRSEKIRLYCRQLNLLLMLSTTPVRFLSYFVHRQVR